MSNGTGPASGLVFEDLFTGDEMHFLPPSGPTPKELAGSAALSFAGAGDLQVIHGLQRLEGAAGLTLSGSARAAVAWSLGAAGALSLEATDTSGILKGTAGLVFEGAGACRAAWTLGGTAVVNLDGSAAAGLIRSVVGNAPLICSAQAGLARRRSVAGTCGLTCALNDPRLVRFWIPSLSVPAGQWDRRRLTWATDEPVELWIDGEHYATLEGGELIVPHDLEIRQMLDVWDEPPEHVPTPDDRVALSWTGDAVFYQVWRRKDGGAWEMIDRTELTEYVDGPLPDGAYDYRVVALDEEGDAAESEVKSMVVNSAPESPARLTLE
ncbi:MAG: hypothetical protein ACLFWL_09060 [Candidatus Brocadiia bacterium]